MMLLPPRRKTITAGDQVILRLTESGTQTGPFMGAPASGIHAEWLGIGIYTVSYDKISTGRFGEDALGMMPQLAIVDLGQYSQLAMRGHIDRPTKPR